MFGYHDIPLKLIEEGFSVSIERQGETLIYRREYLDDIIDKVLLTSNCKVLINPIEPLNTPKELSHYLLIEFEKTFIVEPKATKKIYIKFPVETGVFIAVNKKNNGDRDFEILDIFSLARQKFTLYGDIRNGILCKYWLSDVFPSMPSANPLHEGIIELNVLNKTNKWTEVTKAVLNAYQMKLYYSKSMVSIKAIMTVIDDNTAETDFEDKPIEKGMSKSLELYISRKLPVITTKFILEWGI